MKLTRIIAAAAAAGVLLALCGCGDSGSSSTSEPAAEQTTQAAKRTKRDSTSGEFSFDINERFSQYEGVFPADFEFMLIDTETDISAGVMENVGIHITPEYYCESIKEHYEELYGTVTSTKSEQDGLPAHILESEFRDEESGKDLIFYHKAIGYGNGELLVWVLTAPKGAKAEIEKALDELMEGTTYNGEPAKSEPETHDTEFFTITADKDWYFYSAKDAEATVRPNIASDEAGHFGSFKISAEKSEAAAAELAAKDAEEFGTKDNIENVEQTDGVQILGRDAVKVSCVLKSEYMDLKRDIYYFGSNGANYKVQILAPTECFDEFSEMVTALTDTIEIK